MSPRHHSKIFHRLYILFIIFYLELLKIEEPGTFEKETWLLDENEKRNTIPRLKEAGNIFYNKGMYKEAEEKYTMALGLLEQIMTK